MRSKLLIEIKRGFRNIKSPEKVFAYYVKYITCTYIM